MISRVFGDGCGWAESNLGRIAGRKTFGFTDTYRWGEEIRTPRFRFSAAVERIVLPYLSVLLQTNLLDRRKLYRDSEIGPDDELRWSSWTLDAHVRAFLPVRKWFRVYAQFGVGPTFTGTRTKAAEGLCSGAERAFREAAMKRATLLLSSMVFVLSGATACETDLIDDAGFQLWCGDRLCAWELEEGEIRKVSTWHEHDYGVELLGAPVLLSQAAQDVAVCVRIEVTSEVDAGAMVSVEVDADGDGEVEWSVRLQSSEGFVSRVYDFALHVSTDGVFYLRKLGQGRAVVARFRVSDECGE